MTTHRILGIDPGSRITGFGIIEIHKHHSFYLASGCIRTHSLLMPARLYEIYSSLQEIIQEYRPTCAAIEQIFLHHNPNSALKLGQARGAAIVAIAQHQLTIYEYTPTQVKQAIVGKGHAAKNQIQQMVKVLLTLNDVPQADAADALAIALCHAHHYPLLPSNLTTDD